eukprot:s2854_g2.t1
MDVAMPLPVKDTAPAERFTMIRITVQGCKNFPSRVLRRSARSSVSIKVREQPPNNPEGDASLPIPASFEFLNGHLEERADERFPWM